MSGTCVAIAIIVTEGTLHVPWVKYFLCLDRVMFVHFFQLKALRNHAVSGLYRDDQPLMSLLSALVAA